MGMKLKFPVGTAVEVYVEGGVPDHVDKTADGYVRGFIDRSVAPGFYVVRTEGLGYQTVRETSIRKVN